MKRVLALLLCLVMLLSITACKKKDGVGSYVPTTTTAAEEKVDPTYALDPIVNRFFVEFLDKYGTDVMNVQSIRRAPGTESTPTEDLTKTYLCEINGLNVTVRNASYTATPEGQEPYDVYLLRIAIEGGLTESSRDKMMQVFSLIARSVDTGCSDKLANDAIETMEAMTEGGEVRVSSFVKVERYTPIVKEYGVPTKIEMLAVNYIPPVD